jgi:hypothetical protein
LLSSTGGLHQVLLSFVDFAAPLASTGLLTLLHIWFLSYCWNIRQHGWHPPAAVTFLHKLQTSFPKSHSQNPPHLPQTSFPKSQQNPPQFHQNPTKTLHMRFNF